jgi:hypothetical protein
MTYKSDLNRVSDAIIPFVLEGLMLCQIKQDPPAAPHYEKPLKILRKAINAEVMHDKKVMNRLVRIEKKLLKFWVKNKQVNRKSIMVMSHLAAALVAQEKAFEDEEGNLIIEKVVDLSQELKDLLQEINEIFVGSYSTMPEIEKIDISAAKQAPKVLKLLQEEGLFN